jgi:LETM1 and EF-hand domain-containing protein 1, mitochondrial
MQVGFKLFGFELRVATRLVWKQLQGQALTRRERKQLTRTTADLFRMVPFTLFIIIPFAEILLPVALRIFPNMLPSTFQTQLKQARAALAAAKALLHNAYALPHPWTSSRTALVPSGATLATEMRVPLQLHA